MRVYMCMHACGWVDVARVEVVGGVSANVSLSLCIPTSMLMSIFLTHPPFARFYTLISLACEALSIVCLRENIVFFLSLLQSSPLSVSAYLIHSAPLITLFFYLSKPLLHDLFVCLSFPPFIPLCLPFLPSSPSEMSLCHLFDQGGMAFFFLLPWKHQSKSPTCSETQGSNTPKV